jgi:hypothetical protein
MHFLDHVVDVSDFVSKGNLMWENGVMRKFMELNTKDTQTIICRKKKRQNWDIILTPQKNSIWMLVDKWKPKKKNSKREKEED